MNGFLLVSLGFLLIESTQSAKEGEHKCEDKVHNLIKARSDFKKPKPAFIKSFSGTIYNHDLTPSCAYGKPTVPMPGWVTLLEGEMHLPRKYELLKTGIMRITVRGNGFDDALCLNGESQYLALPSNFCKLKLCDFIGEDICKVFEEPGVHTIKELEEKIGFNSTLELPEPPSLLGISLLDVFSGEFSFGFQIESEGEVVLDVSIPTNNKWLQVGVSESTKEEEDD
ncbi:unnamed protein product [Bursaphelenchus xylophilus]|uniref:(pine wood nematode) hypothetical protein n=1 Tax=Bursaphelenchus xylophilus TaxID=6326 RepID=A0A1I7RQ25_BURXY|nr:unnamed protein product [Bursaphelenchus xylophilus]CAG9097034.1 unnamed protein product [Bursaphelenchus xylophilus]